MKKIIALIFLFLIQKKANSISIVPDQWTLQKVEILLTSSKVIQGYICIYENNLLHINSINKPKFNRLIDSLRNYHVSTKNIELFKSIIINPKIYNGTVLSTQKANQIELDNISSITRIPSSFNGFSGGWSDINIVSKAELKLLSLKIENIVKSEGAGRNFDVISYDPNIKLNELHKILDELLKSETKEVIEIKSKYLKKKIVILQFESD